MTEESKSGQGPALIAMRVASLWLLAGALFKLFKGSPADLPPTIVEIVGKGNITLFFKSAIGIELAVVVLTWLKPRLGWFLLAGTFAVFLALLLPLVLEGAESCGCFGGSITIPPIVMVGIDGVLLLAMLATKPWARVKTSGGPMWLVGLLIAAGLAAPWLIIKDGSAVETPGPSDPSGENTEVTTGDPRFVVFEFDKWQGKSIYDADFPLTPWLETNIEELSPDGEWIFWRKTCDHCAKHLLELAGGYAGEPLVLIRDIEDGDDEAESVVTVMPEGPSVQHTQLRDAPSYFMTTPVVMQVSGGDVLGVEENAGGDEH
jgi:hypothetical protein